MSSSTFTPSEIQAAIAAHSGDKPAPSPPGELAAEAQAAEPAEVADDATGQEPAGDDAEVPEVPADDYAPVDAAEAKPEGDDKEGKPVPAKTWAAVFRRERLAREREAQGRSQLAQARAMHEQAQKAQAEAQGILAKLKADPYEFVETVGGFDYDTWAKRRLANGKRDPSDETAALRGELEKMRAEAVTEREKANQAAQEAQMRGQVETWLAKVPTVLADPKYKLIADYGAAEEIPALAGLELKSSGKWLTQEECADRILGQLKAKLDALSKAGHIRFAPGDNPKAAEPKTKAKPPVDDGPDTELVVKGRKRTRPMTRHEEIRYLTKKYTGA